MFKLHVIQARSGDCLLLEFGPPKQPRHILVDGGPPGNYASAVRPALDDIVGRGGEIELVVLSRIESSHMVGLLELFGDIEEDKVSALALRNRVGQLWYNPSGSLDRTGEIAQRLQSVVAMAEMAGVALPCATDALRGMGEENHLRLAALKLAIPVNRDFDGGLVLAETAKRTIAFGPLELAVVGPRNATLEALQAEWLGWLAATARKIAADHPAAATADRSVPDFGSIVLLASCEGKTVLLCGDAGADHITAGLKSAGPAEGGRLHVDVLKVPHHGSDRNATQGFFEAVTADTYVVSADGSGGNPALATLQRIVQSARGRGRRVSLVVTSETESCRQLREQFDPAVYGYTLQTLEPGRQSLAVPLAP